MISNILVVCIGNICRSPMAEALLDHSLGSSNLSHIHVSSAGLRAISGCPSDGKAVQVMEKRGIDISAHRARQINLEQLRRADLVLVMERSHLKVIESTHMTARGRVYLLGRWSGTEIHDPYGHKIEIFERVAQLIAIGVSEWVSKLRM